MKLHQALLALLAAGALLGQDTVKIDKDDFLRHVETWQLPEYPRKSASERHAGVVTATVGVDGQGHVTNVNIVSTPDVHLAETVKAGVSQWVFRPFREAGKAKAVESTIYIEFRLQPMGPNVMIPGLTKQPEEAVKAPRTRPDL